MESHARLSGVFCNPGARNVNGPWHYKGNSCGQDSASWPFGVALSLLLCPLSYTRLLLLLVLPIPTPGTPVNKTELTGE